MRYVLMYYYFHQLQQTEYIFNLDEIRPHREERYIYMGTRLKRVHALKIRLKRLDLTRFTSIAVFKRKYLGSRYSFALMLE